MASTRCSDLTMGRFAQLHTMFCNTVQRVKCLTSRGASCLGLEGAVIPLDEHHRASVVGRVRKRQAAVRRVGGQQLQAARGREGGQARAEVGLEHAVRVAVGSAALHDTTAVTAHGLPI